jgi:hypothetical protein
VIAAEKIGRVEFGFERHQSGVIDPIGFTHAVVAPSFAIELIPIRVGSRADWLTRARLRDPVAAATRTCSQTHFGQENYRKIG